MHSNHCCCKRLRNALRNAYLLTLFQRQKSSIPCREAPSLRPSCWDNVWGLLLNANGSSFCSSQDKLNEKHSERMRFYLSKADTAGHESDRQVGGQFHKLFLWTLINILLFFWSLLFFVFTLKISQSPLVIVMFCHHYKLCNFFCFSESADADYPGAVQETRTEQGWIWHSHNLHTDTPRQGIIFII